MLRRTIAPVYAPLEDDDFSRARIEDCVKHLLSLLPEDRSGLVMELRLMRSVTTHEEVIIHAP